MTRGDQLEALLEDRAACTRSDAEVIAAATAPAGQPCNYYPANVIAALELLADYGSKTARERHPEFEHHDRLKAWISGALDVAISDPDYSSATDAARETD